MESTAEHDRSDPARLSWWRAILEPIRALLIGVAVIVVPARVAAGAAVPSVDLPSSGGIVWQPFVATTAAARAADLLSYALVLAVVGLVLGAIGRGEGWGIPARATAVCVAVIAAGVTGGGAWTVLAMLVCARLLRATRGPARPSWSWRRRIVAATAACLTWAAFAGAAWASFQNPPLVLASDGEWSCVQGDGLLSPAGAGASVVYAHRQGGVAETCLTVVNRSDGAVTLLGLARRRAASRGPWAVGLESLAQATAPPPAGRFAPAWLGPGDQIEVVLRLRMAACPPANGPHLHRLSWVRVRVRRDGSVRSDLVRIDPAPATVC